VRSLKSEEKSRKTELEVQRRRYESTKGRLSYKGNARARRLTGGGSEVLEHEQRALNLKVAARLTKEFGGGELGPTA